MVGVNFTIGKLKVFILMIDICIVQDGYITMIIMIVIITIRLIILNVMWTYEPHSGFTINMFNINLSLKRMATGLAVARDNFQNISEVQHQSINWHWNAKLTFHLHVRPRIIMHRIFRPLQNNPSCVLAGCRGNFYCNNKIDYYVPY